MNKRVVLPIVGAVAVLAVAAGAIQWMTVWRWQENTDDAYLASDITTISAKVSGHVVSVEVQDNQPVHKGDVLARIDDRDYKAKVDQARALVAAREATLANLEARLASQRSSINAAEAQIGSASAEVTRSQADLERSRALVRESYVSRQLLDTNKADALKANAQMKAVSASAEATRRQLAVLETERQMDLAQVDEARAELAATELDLEHTVVVAPADGVVGNRSVQLGLYVRTGSPLLSLVPLDQVWVVANFKETQIGKMQPGQAAEIEVDSFAGQKLTGHVDSFSPASGAKFALLPPDNATGNFTKVVQRIPVKVLVDAANPLAGKLRPGMSAVVTVDTKRDTANGQGPAPKALTKAP